jgi:hypothetical protein
MWAKCFQETIRTFGGQEMRFSRSEFTRMRTSGILYYIPNGVPLSRKLGVAIGQFTNSFTQ